ncbi:hypothetical protein BX616_002551, partial [Lobosporangium transversale]
MSAITSIFQYLFTHATHKNNAKLAVAFFAFFLYKYRGHALGTRRRHDLKEPKGALPFLGHMTLLSSIPPTELYQFFEKLNEELGPVWSISLPNLRMIQIDTPENIEYVHKTNFWSYEKGPMFRDVMGVLFGDGIFGADGEEWRFQRKLASHIFSVKAFREYTTDVFVVESKKVLEHLGRAADQGKIIDFHDLMNRFTLDSFGTYEPPKLFYIKATVENTLIVSFGESFGCLDDITKEVEFAFAFDDLAEICSFRLIDPFWKLRERLTSLGKRAKMDRDVIRGHALRAIQKRKQEGHHGHRKDLLQLFMDAKTENGEPLSDDMMIDIFLNFT